MKKYIDLHIHTKNSDGTDSVKEIFEIAKNTGFDDNGVISAIAITDHDGTFALSEAEVYSKSSGIELITGVEISAKAEKDIHILGYFIDYTKPDFQKSLFEIRLSRQRRNKKLLDRLNELGFALTENEVESVAGDKNIGRAHFAYVMMQKGYVGSVTEAFEKYLSVGSPAYIQRETITPEDAINIIHSCGGQAFLAHPHKTGYTRNELYDYIKHLCSCGLDGIEGYYSEYDENMGKNIRDIANMLNLSICGGSDYHGKIKPNLNLGTGYGQMRIPYFVLEEMKSRR